MWCRHCKQDVPAVAPAADGAIHCARCQGPLERPAFAKGVSDTGVALDQPYQPAVDSRRLLEGLEGIDTKHRYSEIRRSIRAAQRQADATPAMMRFDPPEPLAVASQPAPAAGQNDTLPREPHRPSQWVAWSLAFVGAMALGAGIGLMFWSLSGERPELWNWGVAATLGGQGLLIVGLVQLLASLWTANRTASLTLQGVHHELRRLGRTTESLLGANSSSAANFYADLARGASPQLLLANLKSQVDALSSHVTRR